MVAFFLPECWPLSRRNSGLFPVGMVAFFGRNTHYYEEVCKNGDEARARYDRALHDNHKLVAEIRERHTRILLRINPKDDAVLVDSLDKVLKLFDNNKTPESTDEIEEKIKNLVEVSQTLLKKEWRRVKRGEPTFWIAKYSALFAIIFFIGLSLWAVTQYQETSKHETDKHNETMQPTANAAAD